jgi:formaldehyde-activating enzyme involved in methanogenesis
MEKKLTMDNYYFIEGRKETINQPYEKTVHEHRAPTDDSIRIYNEMVQKAQQSVIDAFRIDSNVIKANIVVMYNMADMKKTVYFNYELNSVAHKGHFDLELYDIQNRQPVIEQVAKAIANNVTEFILNQFQNEDIHRLLSDR